MKIEQVHIDQIHKQFTAIKNKEDLVSLLNMAKKILYGNDCEPILLKDLIFYANPKLCKKRYKTFSIKKKSGSDRTIHAPINDLKTILRSLNFVLQCLYTPHEAATGFVKNKSIVDNAIKHEKQNYVFNIDLKDFFHSFDRNRVKTGFMYKPFNLNGKKEPLAFLLASLCTHPFMIDKKIKICLPQGSPASPTITNILCKKLDNRLNGLANRFGLNYTRYADDITFSSKHNIYKEDVFQKELFRIIEEDQKLIVNPTKTRLQKKGYKQEVTGLVVNKKTNVNRKYIKQIRMYLYFLEKYGSNKANQIFKHDYKLEKDNVKKNNISIINVIDGKLEFLKMVKGNTNSTYRELKNRFDKIAKASETFNKVENI